MPEGHAMARYLKDRGVDPQRIVIEDRSSSTMENFRYSKELIGEQRKLFLSRINFMFSDQQFWLEGMVLKLTGMVRKPRESF